MAHRLGFGPHVVAKKISMFLGTGEERYERLSSLRDEIPPKLEKNCFRLMKYTLPTESPKTQRLAFDSLVTLVTLFPGLRALFLRSDCMRSIEITKDGLSELWHHPEGASDDDWDFWKTFATTCLSDIGIAPIVEECPVSHLVLCQADIGSLSTIERLLVVLDCE
ncbi:hypothetical protein B0H11DRAFT_2088065 [Mycena galericulata]|nr:hypothetical protein B0H11DRAFT_2088065 [Mycena galericulata]